MAAIETNNEEDPTPSASTLNSFSLARAATSNTEAELELPETPPPLPAKDLESPKTNIVPRPPAERKPLNRTGSSLRRSRISTGLEQRSVTTSPDMDRKIPLHPRSYSLTATELEHPIRDMALVKVELRRSSERQIRESAENVATE